LHFETGQRTFKKINDSSLNVLQNYSGEKNIVIKSVAAAQTCFAVAAAPSVNCKYIRQRNRLPVKRRKNLRRRFHAAVPAMTGKLKFCVVTGFLDFYGRKKSLSVIGTVNQNC